MVGRTFFFGVINFTYHFVAFTTETRGVFGIEPGAMTGRTGVFHNSHSKRSSLWEMGGNRGRCHTEHNSKNVNKTVPLPRSVRAKLCTMFPRSDFSHGLQNVPKPIHSIDMPPPFRFKCCLFNTVPAWGEPFLKSNSVCIPSAVQKERNTAPNGRNVLHLALNVPRKLTSPGTSTANAHKIYKLTF